MDTQAQIPPQWLTVEQAAAYLQVCPTTLRNIIHAGRLRAVRIGLNFRIERTDLDQFLKRAKQLVAPYRCGTRPWVAERHAENRRKRAARLKRAA